jgi:hypothetical protein
MNIVTVTCTRDKFAMLLQAQSINLYVTTKVTHYVIIQDLTTSYAEWEELLQPYYQYHELTIIPNWLNNDLNGWTQQQLLKFESSKFINSDRYLILDSKNLFIKSTSLEEFTLEGHRHYVSTSLLTKQYSKWYRYIMENLNATLPKMSWVPQTPFTVNTKVIKLITDINLEKFFVDFNNRYPNDHPSEFLLYRFFSDIPKNKHNYQHIIWDQQFLKKLNEIDDEVICLGIHREALRNTSLTNTDVINLVEWLVTLNFEKQAVLNFVNSFTRP